MSAAHTPGPWRQEVNTTLVWGKCNRHDDSSYGMGYPVADVQLCRGWKRHGEDNEPTTETALANACLIASAPDLLAACRAAYAWGYAEHHGLGSFAQRITLCSHSESLVAIAIAKAEGRPVPDYKGSKRMTVWPNVDLEESSIAEGDALVKAAFEHEAVAKVEGEAP